MTTLDLGLHGESHMHLYENLRRFNHHASYTVTTPSATLPIRILNLPINVGASQYRTSLTEIQRSDKIVQLHDAFRFFRGSMRYLILITGNSSSIIRYVHTPQVQNYPFTLASQLESQEYEEAGYGEVIQSLQQNNVTTIEVPMYLPTNCVLTASYDSPEYLVSVSQGLGTVGLFYQGNQSNLSINVSRALGDDAHFYGFNGFPLRTPITPIPPALPFYNSRVRADVTPAGMINPAVNIGFKLNVEDKIIETMGNVDDLSLTLKDFINSLNDGDSQCVLIGTLVSQIAHVIVNPCFKTFSISVFQILLSFKIIKLEFMAKFQSMLSGVWDKIVHQISPAGAVEDDINVLSEMSATLVAGAAAYFDKGNDKVNLTFTDKITNAFVTGGSIHSRILVFIKAIFTFLKKVVNWVTLKFFPDSILHKYLTEDYITKWIARSNTLTDTLNYTKIKSCRRSTTLIFKLIRQGESILLHVTRKERKSIPILVSQTLASLKRLRDKIAPIAHLPKVKYDPFCIYIYGKQSQIGKSEMLTHLAEEIMEENGLCASDCNSKIYVVPESDKWWSGYVDEKCVLFDDFARMCPVDAAESDCSLLCNLKGEAPWEVPKPFEDKGAQSVCKLIVCASNFSHPKHSGIANKHIVWERRNVMYSVKANWAVFNSCQSHEVFRFACSECIAANPNENFKLRRHLQILEMDAVIEPPKAIGNVMNYEEFRVEVLKKARNYYTMQDGRYANALSEKKQRNEKFENFLVPTDINSDYTELLSDEFYNSVLSEIEGIKGAGMLDKVWSKLGRKKDLSLEWAYSCPHEQILQENIEPDSYQPVAWTINGQDVDDINPCCDSCHWAYLRACYWGQLYNKIMENESEVPIGFPTAYNLQRLHAQKMCLLEYTKEIEQEEWFRKKVKFFKIVGIGLSLIGVLGIVKWIYAKKEVVNDAEIDASIARADSKHVKIKMGKEGDLTMKLAHPALMASGDVRTKFAARMKSFTQKAKSFVATRATVKPSGENEFESMKETYVRSLLEMQTTDKHITARCVSVENKFYITQVHSFCSVFYWTAKKMAEEYKKCSNKKCNKEAETPTHCEDCVNLVNKNNSMLFTRYNSKLDTETVKVTLKELMAMNDSIFGVDSDGSDMVTFQFHINDSFTTKNVSKYLVSKNNHFVDTTNFVFMDPGSMKNKNSGGNTHDAKNVLQISEKLSYSKDDCKEWSETAVSCVFHGYTIDNPNPGGNTQACGSILMDKTTCTIVGLMSAASKSILYFNSICREYIQSAYQMSQLWMMDTDGNRIQLVTPAYNIKELDDEFMGKDLKVFTVGNAEKPEMISFNSTRTTLRKSDCYEEFVESQKFPAYLSQEGDKGMIAFKKGIDNYRKHRDFPDSHIELAKQDISAMFVANCRSDLETVSKRSVDEAICGIDGKITRIVMNTSPGFPFCCDSSTKRKSDLVTFDEKNKIDWLHPILLEMIESESQSMEDGIKPLTIFQASLKDERLSPNKVDKPRIIQGSSFPLSINSRRYLMDFNYAFQYSRSNLEHCVGINPESLEWNELATKLNQFSIYICVGDFSKFGPRLSSKFVLSSYEIMDDWYSQWFNDLRHKAARKVLGDRVINSLNLFGKYVVEVQCGSPSGAINTVIVNSICNLFYIRCAWIGIMTQQKPEIAGLHHFKKFVLFYCYGDDVIFAVKPEIIEIFNNQTISDYFKLFDIKYTDVTKGEDMRKHCTLEEATFLKRGFKLFTETPIRPGVYIAIPDYKETLDICNWVRKPKGTKTGSDISKVLQEAAISNCEDAIRKIWFHGREVFNETQKKIRAFWLPLAPARMPTYYTFEGLQTDYGIPLYQEKDAVSYLFPDLIRDGRDRENNLVSKFNDEALDKEVETRPSMEVNFINEPVTDESVGCKNLAPSFTPDHTQFGIILNEAKFDP